VNTEALVKRLSEPPAGANLAELVETLLAGERALALAGAECGVDWDEGTGIDSLACLGGHVLSELVAACHRLAA